MKPEFADEVRRRIEAYDRAVAEGFLPQGEHVGTGKRTAVAEAADKLNVDYQCIKRALRHRSELDVPAETPTPEKQAEVRAERLDATFWRRRAAEVEKELAEREAELRAVTGMLDRPVQPPEWAIQRSTGPSGRSVGLLHLSDAHVGEVVNPEEVNGVNAYDPDVFVRRVRRLFSATVEILPRWSADCSLRGVVLAVNGDLVSGDIHDELRRTNALTAMDQAYLCADEIASGVEKLEAAFGVVWVTFTPGNHGRTTEKMHAKRASRLSYDMLVGELVRRHFARSPNVTVTLAVGRDLEYPLFGQNVLQSHGDALGTGGGKGFAGPVLPIARGGRNVDLQAYATNHRHDIKLTAHYHTSANPGRGHFANGSIVGYNEFAASIRATVERPQQWLLHVHERWGVRERCEIVLEDMVREKPRVRVPAFSA